MALARGSLVAAGRDSAAMGSLAGHGPQPLERGVPSEPAREHDSGLESHGGDR